VTVSEEAAAAAPMPGDAPGAPTADPATVPVSFRRFRSWP
jgi:hypothetical protein